MNLVQLLQNIGCKNARNDGMDRISSLRDGRWVEMFAEMGYDRGEFIFPDGRHSSFFLVLPDGNIASADNVMCGNGFYAVANELGIDADAVLGEEPYGEFIMHTDEDGIEDEDTAISIWTPEEFQIKLQQCQQLSNKQVNESKNINKKNTIRLTESELKQIITESVKKIVQEELNTSSYDNVNETKKVYIPLTINWNDILNEIIGKIGENFDLNELSEYFEIEEFNETDVVDIFIDDIWGILPPKDSFGIKEVTVNFLVALENDEFGQCVRFLGKVYFQNEEDIYDAILDKHGPYYAEQLLHMFKDCFEKNTKWTQNLIENHIVYRRIGNNIRVCTKTHPILK